MSRGALPLSRVWALLASLATMAWLTVASAQPAPQLQVQTDVDTVAVGDLLHLVLVAQSSASSPTDPQPGATPGFVVRGQSASPTQTHVTFNGQRMDRWGLQVDWTLQAKRTGVFSLGPVTVVVGGSRFASRAVTVHVVPAGQAPQRQAPQRQAPPGFSPFDPWRGLLPGFDAPDQEPQAPAVTTDPKLALDAPRAPLYFLHATVDRAQAVVGEQVVFSVLEYLDTTAQADVDGSDIHEPNTADFVKHPLLRDEPQSPLAGFAAIGGRTYRVAVVRKWALFPLHAGDLVIGPMSLTVMRPRGAAGPRASESLTVHVSEPPVAGRPPGYALGDVGKFSVTAQVTPREVDQGAAVGVRVEVSGTGNVPASLALPAREGLEWLPPEVHEQLGPIGGDTFGGKRSFDYVVRVLRAGDLELGAVAIPFWDPAARRYEVTRAALGTVRVRPSAQAAPAADGRDPGKLPALPGPRDTPSGARLEGRPHADDSPLFWWLGVGAWPLAFGASLGGRAAAGRVRRAWSARKASPATELRRRISEATAACDGADGRAVLAATERAVQAATAALAQVSVRGAVGGELEERLIAAAVSPEAAAQVAGVLRACEAARFSPERADLDAARAVWARAREAIRRLERRA